MYFLKFMHYPKVTELSNVPSTKIKLKVKTDHHIIYHYGCKLVGGRNLSAALGMHYGIMDL